MKRIFENLPEPGRKRKSDLFHLLCLQVFFFFQENLLSLECYLYSHHSLFMQKYNQLSRTCFPSHPLVELFTDWDPETFRESSRFSDLLKVATESSPDPFCMLLHSIVLYTILYCIVYYTKYSEVCYGITYYSPQFSDLLKAGVIRPTSMTVGIAWYRVVFHVIYSRYSRSIVLWLTSIVALKVSAEPSSDSYDECRGRPSSTEIWSGWQNCHNPGNLVQTLVMMVMTMIN